MKKHLLFLAVLIATLASCGSDKVCPIVSDDCNVEAPSYTAIPNLGFEEWRYDSVSNYYEPMPINFWVTPNEASELFEGGPTVEKVSGKDAYNGQGFAAKLTTRATVSPINAIIPVAGGAIATGQFTSTLNSPISSLIFGRPFNKRITKVSGYYKYYPIDGDSCGIYAFMRECVARTDECGDSYNTLDTLAFAEFSTSSKIEDYTKFELNLNYSNANTPDDVVIYFTSSYLADEGRGGVGSTLYIDELAVEYE